MMKRERTTSKLLSVALIALLIDLASAPCVRATTQANADKEARSVAKIKAAVAKLGTGPKARVEVKRRSNGRVKGYISEVSEDHFSVIDNKTSATIEIPYSQVKQVKKLESTKHSVAVGLALLGGVIGALFIIVVVGLKE